MRNNEYGLVRLDAVEKFSKSGSRSDPGFS